MARRRRTSRGSQRCLAGFSLIELTVVVMIIGVFGAVAVPRYAASLNRYRVDAAVRRIVADLELCRAHARATSQSQWFSFVPANETYTASFKINSAAPALYSVNLSEAPYHVDLVSAVFTNGATLKFDGFGMPDGGGGLVISSGSYSKTIAIDQATGGVSVP